MRDRCPFPVTLRLTRKISFPSFGGNVHLMLSNIKMKYVLIWSRRGTDAFMKRVALWASPSCLTLTLFTVEEVEGGDWGSGWGWSSSKGNASTVRKSLRMNDLRRSRCSGIFVLRDIREQMQMDSMDLLITTNSWISGQLSKWICFTLCKAISDVLLPPQYSRKQRQTRLYITDAMRTIHGIHLNLETAELVRCFQCSAPECRTEK